jgi:ATP synthase protein I
VSGHKRPADLDEAVERRRARREAWKREGERSLASNLAMVGTLGWLIVVPALIGTFVGRWIDRKTGMGVTFTSALMCLGIVAGSVLAWKKVRSA